MKRLAGVVVEKEVDDENVDMVSLGLKIFSLRAEIMALWADCQPVLDVVKTQWPKILARARELYARLMPEAQANLAANAPVATFSALWVQKALLELGYSPGKPDGIHGSASRAAVRNFQADHGLLPDEWPGRETILAIGVALAAKKAAA